MKKIRWIALVLACICLCAVLASCGAAKDSVAGVWGCSYSYNGNSFDCVLTINDNGTYAEAVTKNGGTPELESNTWEIVDGKLRLHHEDESWSTYEMSGDTLKNGEYKTYKKLG